MCGRATLTMVASSTTMSWAVAMTSSARPRRRLPPPAVAAGEAACPVTDRADRVVGRSGALPAPEAGDVTTSPLDLGHVPGGRAIFRDGPRLAVNQVRGRHLIPVIRRTRTEASH